MSPLLHDPLLALVRDYRVQIEAYNNPPDSMTKDEEAAYAASTFQPLYRTLCIAPPNATSLEGALEAIRLVVHEEVTCGSSEGLTVNVLNAALAYFDG